MGVCVDEGTMPYIQVGKIENNFGEIVPYYTLEQCNHNTNTILSDGMLEILLAIIAVILICILCKFYCPKRKVDRNPIIYQHKA